MRFQNKQQLELTQFCVDNATDAIILLNRDGQFIYVNDAAVSHFQYSREELLGMTIHQVDPNNPQETWAETWERFQRKRSDLFEAVHKTKDGTLIPVEIKVNHFILDGEEYHFAFVRNLTEKKDIEKSLRRSERRLRTILDVTSDGVWDRDLQTGDVYYGKRWAASLGYNDEDLYSGRISWERLLHPDDKEKTLRALHDHLLGLTDDYEAEFRLRNSEGHWQWMYARGKVIEFDENGRPLRFVGTHSDITKRKVLEENLLKNSEEMKLFAYSVAHDLKNPAIAIKGLVDRLDKCIDDLTSEQKKEYCSHIADSAGQLVDLVEKLSLYISSKENVTVFEEHSLYDIVHDCRGEFAAQLQYRGVKWHDFAEKPLARIDRLALRRVLRNLIENSLKYGGEDLSEIRVEYQNTPEYHILSVSDDGAGIPLADTITIFQPFERGVPSAEQKGAGLGLAIVKEIAHQHGGEVWVEQRNSRGVKFCFAFSKKL